MLLHSKITDWWMDPAMNQTSLLGLFVATVTWRPIRNYTSAERVKSRAQDGLADGTHRTIHTYSLGNLLD